MLQVHCLGLVRRLRRQSGPLPLVLHLSQGSAGTLTGTLDSTNQGASSIPCTPILFAGGHLTIDLPSIHAHYEADESPDGKILTGTWTQSSSLPLILQQQATSQSALHPSTVHGDWHGTLDAPTGPLATVLHIKSDITGKRLLAFDSPAQHVFGLAEREPASTGVPSPSTFLRFTAITSASSAPTARPSPAPGRKDRRRRR